MKEHFWKSSNKQHSDSYTRRHSQTLADKKMAYPIVFGDFPDTLPLTLEEQEVEEWHDIEVYGDAYNAFTAKHPDHLGDSEIEYEVLNTLEEEHNRDILRCGWDQWGDCWDFRVSGGWWYEDIGGGNSGDPFTGT